MLIIGKLVEFGKEYMGALCTIFFLLLCAIFNIAIFKITLQLLK